MTALHQFGAEMLKLSRGLDSFPVTEVSSHHDDEEREHSETASTSKNDKCGAHENDLMKTIDDDDAKQHQRESISTK